jgi:apolipoprotein N-acyltransferase
MLFRRRLATSGRRAHGEAADEGAQAAAGAGNLTLVLGRAAAGAAGGLVLAAALPPVDLLPGVFVGLAILAGTLTASAHPSRHGLAVPARRAYGLAAVAGLGFGVAAHLVGQTFVLGALARFAPVGGAVAALLFLAHLAIQAVPWVAAGLGFTALARRGVPAWGAFPLAVYIATFVPVTLPWTAAGCLSPWTAFVQFADVVGERGLTGIVALVAALLAEGIRLAARPPTRRTGGFTLTLALAIPGALAVYGKIRLQQVDADRAAGLAMNVAVLQPNIDAKERWDPAKAESILAHLVNLTAEAERAGSALTVWPEGTYPYLIPHGSRRAPEGARALVPPGVTGPVLAGLIMPGEHGPTNSAVIATSDGELSQSADKMHLVPFGETVPLGQVFPWLRRTFAMSGGYVAGDAHVVLMSGLATAVVFNCIEDVLPGAGRDALPSEPNILVSITNDAWFAGSPESEIHLRMATMRAIELRRDLVRAVNGGAAGWIDAAGRVQARTAGDAPGLAVAKATLLEGLGPPYARFGDLPWLALVTALLYRRLRRTSGAPAPFAGSTAS